MARQQSVAKTSRKRAPKPLAIGCPKSETESQSFASLTLSPSFLAATAIGRFTKVGQNGIALGDLISELGKQIEKVHDGNLVRAESLLVRKRPAIPSC